MNFRECVSIFKGSFKVTTLDGQTSATYKMPKGKGHVVFNLGSIELGKKNTEADIDKLLEPIASVQKALEQERVRLAGVLVALEGHTTGSNDCKQGDYGWSLAFEKAKELREKYGNLKKHLEEIKYEILAPLETDSLGGNFAADHNPGEIIGHWHEDGNAYIIKCPEQLREALLYLLQNVNKLKYKD